MRGNVKEEEEGERGGENGRGGEIGGAQGKS